MKKLQHLWEELNASFWFIPLLLLLLSIAASIGFISLDRQLNFIPEGPFRFLFPESAGSARTILSIIAGAMIGVAGTVFSITLVALTLASSQFGSRLLRNFMYDRLNQVVLGAYVASFVYCLIVLNTVSETDGFQFVPILSVMVGLMIAIVNIFLLIIFIHHIAVSIQSDNVISNISSSMSKSIIQLFPDQLGEESEDEDDKVDIEAIKKNWKATTYLKSLKSGYLQSIDNDNLLNAATENNLLVILLYKPGDYLVEGLQFCEVYSNAEVKGEVVRAMQSAFIIGSVRTPIQDAEYSIHQMVEIAARALSPGINDPYTAITCIDNLSAVMCYLAHAKFPSPYRYDGEGDLRVVADSLTFNGMLNAAFNQIRQYSEGSPSVVIRLMEALITINRIAINRFHKAAISKHANMVFNTAKRTFKEGQDLKDLEERYQNLTNNNS
ncbi:MAG: DUF2254 domain-containing protein [Cyclobacteriaceae bacterium]